MSLSREKDFCAHEEPCSPLSSAAPRRAVSLVRKWTLLTYRITFPGLVCVLSVASIDFPPVVERDELSPQTPLFILLSLYASP